MTTTADYTVEEWELLIRGPFMAAMAVIAAADYTAEAGELRIRGPFMAAMAVIAASPSGPIGVIKELSAVGKLLQETNQSSETKALINALVSDVKAGARPSGTTEQGQRPEEVKDLALRTCQEVAALLARKAPAPEAEGFKRWLLTAAQQAAEASKQGRFLGIGGMRVSAAEQAVLTELAGLLGVTT
jgi:hypothetical protein